MKKKIGLIFLVTGIILCIAGACMLAYGIHEVKTAREAMAELEAKRDDSGSRAREESEESSEAQPESQESKTSDDESSEPSGDTASEPSGDAASEPSGDAASEPSGDATSKPSDDTASKPSGDAASKPSGDAASKPSGDAASKPSGEKKPTETLTADMAVPSACGALSVNGTQLVDENGNPVQLRGISTHGLAWFPSYVNGDAFKQFREDWNVNVMRLAMYTHENGGYCTDGNKDNLKNIIYNGVQYATENDMYVIIDWHVLQEQNPNRYKEEAKKFFEDMSNRYKDNNNVIYEICNEPNGGVSWSEIKSYAEEIIGVIRANDENAVILVGTPNWSQRVDEAAKDPITGYDNIMYTLHFYAATHKDDLRNTMVNAINDGLPVFVSEYGICDASGNGSLDKNSAQKWVDTMNEYGVSYVCWALANKNESAALIKSSCSKTSQFGDDDLSESGKWLYQTLTNKATVGNSNDASSGKPESGSGNGNNNNSNNTGSAATPEPFQSGGLDGVLTLNNSWESDGEVNYQYNMSLTNNGSQSVSSWAIDIHFSDNISLSSGWGGKYTVNGNTLHVIPESYNESIGAGASLGDLGFIISGPSGLKVTP